MYQNQLILHQNQIDSSSEYTNVTYFMSQQFTNKSLNLVDNIYQMELKQHIQVQLVLISNKIRLFKIVATIILIFFIFVMLMIGKVGFQGQNSWNLPFIAVTQRSRKMGQHPAIVQSKSRYINIKKINNIKYDKSSNQRQKQKNIPNIKPLNQMSRQAANQLIRPTNTKLRVQIVNFLPYSQQPHCLIVRQSHNRSKEFHSEIVKSIFNQQYDNFVIIFVQHENKPLLSQEQIQKIENEVKRDSQSNPRIYYFINKSALSYFDYKYLTHNLCVEKSTVFIVNNPLKSDALLMSHRFHQLGPFYLTFSQNQSMYTVNSFLMRVFDLIQQNDFTGTNLKYLKEPNQQCLLALALLELSRKFSKKISFTTYNQQSQKQQKQRWDFSIRKDDQSSYDRYSYQMLLALSQAYYIDNIDEMLGNVLQIEDGQFKQKQQTQLTELQRLQFIEQRQAPYLPNNSALSALNFRRLNRKYGNQANFEGSSSMTNIVERPICAVMIGQGLLNNHEMRMKKHLQTISQVLNQNYTNFHVVYINDGLSQQIEAEVNNKIRNKKNIYYVKNNQSKYHIQNIVKSAYKYCNQNQILTVIDSSVSNLNRCFFYAVNSYLSYNPDVWVVYSNYMISATMETGDAHRIFKQMEYVREGKRVTNLHYLSPMPFMQVKLLKKIPLSYHKDQKGEWLKSRCLKSLEHCLAQLSSTYRMEYLPQIMFEYDDKDMLKRGGGQYNINFQRCDSSLQIYVENMKVLSPLGSLDIASTETQLILYQQFK